MPLSFSQLRHRLFHRFHYRLFYRIHDVFTIRVKRGAGERIITVPFWGRFSRQAQEWKPSWKTNLLRKICTPSGSTFLDIGANVGQTLLDHYAGGTGTRYVGFEPNPACLHYLSEIIRLNNLRNYHLVPVGIAAEAGITTLYYDAASPSDDSATLIADLRPGLTLVSQNVPVFPLDTVSRDIIGDSISAVKIDVEGAELYVLQGMTDTLRTMRPVVLCEILFADPAAGLESTAVRNESLEALMQSLNYHILQIIKSPQDSDVASLRRITHLENVIWNYQNKDLCDYLLVPAEKVADIENIVVAAK